MKSSEVRKKYIEFFKSSPRNHKEISPAPLVLQEDPTTLFTSSGMQPLVPFLMGKPHPEGKRLVDSQPSVRTVDIDEVGDNRHLTFFEMLGNWSLGNYFKEEQLNWFYTFLTKELRLNKDRLWVTVFEGNKQVPKDEESVKIWKKIGIPESRIGFYGADKNWWSRTGTSEQMPVGEIGGPDSEVFYDFGEELDYHKKSEFRSKECHINCDCGRYMEIGNSVFMQYKKVGKNKLEELPQKNVDFGGGLERIVAVVNHEPDIYKTDMFYPLVKIIEQNLSIKYDADQVSIRDFRIIADHIKAAVFITASGIRPGNKLQDYVLRRLLRRAVTKTYLRDKSFDSKKFNELVEMVFEIYPGYSKSMDRDEITNVINNEVRKFRATIERGFKELERIKNIDAKKAFDLYQTYGFPLEITKEIFSEKGQKIAEERFQKEFERHQEASRSMSAGVFKGGLADHSPEVVRLHTATHLLLASLRRVLGEHVVQKGQNITRERARFDFPNPQKLTTEQLKQVEDTINEIIQKDLPVNFKVMPKEEAFKTGAIHAFNEKYADTVKVYYVGDELEAAFSKEFCGGPHVSSTGDIGHVRIKKQDKIGAGLIRIYMDVDK
jgi:alanyl-tRNA synthetase